MIDYTPYHQYKEIINLSHKDACAAVIKKVIGFDFGNDFKLLYTGSHDYEEYLYIFSEKDFIPLKEHLESMDEGLQPGTNRRVEHRYTYSDRRKEYENRNNVKAGFTLVEDRMGNEVCGNIEMIAVDYEERTLKHTFTVF